MADKVKIAGLMPDGSSRRGFVRKLGIAGTVLGTLAVAGEAEAQSTLSDADILNFALNLEYLEAEFYTVALTGNTIDSVGVGITGTGSAGATTGGSQIDFSTSSMGTTIKNIVAEIANDEQTHVNVIRAALLAAGAQPIAKPAINLNALGFGFGSVNDFLKLARIFEDIGVTAYGGAAPLIQSKAILSAAARIFGTEAEHVGNIRLLIDQMGIATAPALDGSDVLPPPSGTKFFSTDSNAMTEVRTPGEVLYLAYGSQANATSGGFFPNGANGAITAASAAGASNDGSSLTASPNPITLASGATYGMTTISWSAPTAQVIQVRVGSPTGPLFTDNFPTGSMQTGNWVSDGMTFYLQDVSGGAAPSASNTLATLVVHVIAS